MQSNSPPWNTTTKAIVAVSALALFCLLIWVFRGLLQQVVLAALLAYLLHPLISLIDRRTPVNRVTVVLAVYLTLAVLVVATFSLVGVTTFQQALDLSRRLPDWFEDALAQLQILREQLPESLTVAGISLPVAGLLPELPAGTSSSARCSALLQPILGRGGSLAASVVTGTVAVLGQILLIFIISIYVAVDITAHRQHDRQHCPQTRIPPRRRTPDLTGKPGVGSLHARSGPPCPHHLYCG